MYSITEAEIAEGMKAMELQNTLGARELLNVYSRPISEQWSGWGIWPRICPPPGPSRAARDTIFLNAVNGLFVDEMKAGPMERLYRAFTGLEGGAGQLLREGKRLVLNTLFRGELARLCRLTERIATGTIRGRDLAGPRLSRALAEVLIAFPVYRTYVDGGVTRDADPRYIGYRLLPGPAAQGQNADQLFPSSPERWMMGGAAGAIDLASISFEVA